MDGPYESWGPVMEIGEVWSRGRIVAAFVGCVYKPSTRGSMGTMSRFREEVHFAT